MSPAARPGARAWLVYLVACAAAAGAYVAVGDDAFRRIVFNLFGVSAVVAILLGARRHAHGRRAAWLAFAAGNALFALGDVAFDLYAWRGESTPVPSVADGLYLAGYPVLAVGLAMLVRHRAPGRDVAAALDGAIAAIALGSVAWATVVGDFARDNDLSVATRAVAVAYPLLDLVLAAFVARLLLSGGARSASYRMLASGLLALLVADAIYTITTMGAGFDEHIAADLAWMLSYALWGAAALHPSMRDVGRPAGADGAPATRVALALLSASVLAAPAMIVLRQAQGDGEDVVVLAVASSVLFVAVLLRIRLLTGQLDRSYRALARSAARQRVLTGAATGLVTAAAPDALARTVAQAAVALADSRSAWAAYVVSGPDGEIVAATAGDHPGEAQGPRAHRDPSGPPTFEAPVVVDGVRRGAIVVGGLRSNITEVMPTLTLLASQVSLAVQAADATEREVRTRSERLFGSLVQHASDVVALATADGVVTYLSPGAEAMLGHPPDFHVGRSVTDLVHRDDVAAVRIALTKALEDGLGATCRIEARTKHADGTWRDLESVVTNLLEDADVGAFVLNARDVTQRKALERELHDQAFHDTLTGLPNRALFLDRVEHALRRIGRAGSLVGVLFIDVDDFKMVNDSLGHASGDRLLAAIAQRLADCVRAGDTVARLGGDEFAVLIEDGAVDEIAETVATRIADELAVPFELDGHPSSVSVSIGIALGAPAESTPDELLRDADLAMYMAKRNGKARFERFRPAMHAEAVRRLELVGELRRAIELGELVPHYQPIVDVHTGVTIAVEALVRWDHPTRGLLGPAEFLAVAESTGLIVPLGKVVLDGACRHVAEWRRGRLVDDAFYVSVNVSPRQLQDVAIVEDVARALRDSGLPGAALVLEVTETTFIDDVRVAARRLDALRGLGVRVAIDDFGTGYASLGYLRELPVDIVKIDRSFVDGIADDAGGVAVVRSVVELGERLGLTVVAEGVERDDQLDLLDRLGCSAAQGYLFARPMSSADLVRTLRHPSAHPEAPLARGGAPRRARAGTTPVRAARPPAPPPAT
jgi:diguanylate cyclase (GGDEF)-like protein/PAS domain S-box-containing protein